MDRTAEFIQKIGSFECDIVEANPVVWQNELYIFEYIRSIDDIGRQRCYFNNSTVSYFRFRKVSDNTFSLPFGFGLHMGNAYVDGSRMVVTAVEDWGKSRFYQLESKDLIRWTTPRLILDDPCQAGFNTSVCKAGDKFVMVYELSKPAEKVGVPFTMFFAESRDLVTFRVIEGARFGFDHYTGGPMLRYFDGYYYIFYLNGSYEDGFETCVARSKDLKNWDYSKKNPVLGYGEKDYSLMDVYPVSEVAKLKAAENINASDLDMCEYNGNLELVYSWGNQSGKEFLARAVVPDMTEKEFCESFFA
ncbi:MAG: hypothetical protein E7056_02905 [Lentisphaerae bacterium]|nr:hypothetical protein [Lentisphaerota bacterium]